MEEKQHAVGMQVICLNPFGFLFVDVPVLCVLSVLGPGHPFFPTLTLFFVPDIAWYYNISKCCNYHSN